MRRRTLSSAEVAELTMRLAPFLEGENIRKILKQGVTTVEVGKVKLIFTAGFSFVMIGENTFPALTEANARIIDRLPCVHVDRGAVPKIASGADVMRPGITCMDAFEKGSLVVVRDDMYSKPLAIGQALISSVEAAEATHGRVVKNLHHVDDLIWKTVNNM
ncbi:MAG: PUA domain-containing protein [Candidatus Caldarchaeum sp.]